MGNTIKEDEPILYTVEDIQRIFKMGRSKAYQLMNSTSFPSFRLNKRLYVSDAKLKEWIAKSSGKTRFY